MIVAAFGVCALVSGLLAWLFIAAAARLEERNNPEPSRHLKDTDD